jgi:hypothetical protein
VINNPGIQYSRVQGGGLDASLSPRHAIFQSADCGEAAECCQNSGRKLIPTEGSFDGIGRAFLSGVGCDSTIRNVPAGNLTVVVRLFSGGEEEGEGDGHKHVGRFGLGRMERGGDSGRLERHGSTQNAT